MTPRLDEIVPTDARGQRRQRKSQRAKKRREGGGRRGQKRSKLEERFNPNAAGIDVGSDCHYVAVPEDRTPTPVQRFGAFTADLHGIADWLESCGITSVALESTGVYWIPLFETLEERGFEVLLVDPYKIKHVPSRKTDVLDCQWIQELHSLGFLTPAFRPADEICGLRSLARQRDRMIRRCGDHVRHMQKALAQMNLKLTEVITSITGKTGLRILRAILAGERDPRKLAAMRDGRCHADEATIALALEGTWRDEHLFELRQAVEFYDFYQAQLAACDRELEAKLQSLEARREDLPALEGKRKGQPSHPLQFGDGGYSELYRVTGVDLTRVEGLDAPSVLTIISEIGVDMTKWRSSKAFANWLGLCPGSKVTGGKRLSSQSRRCANRAARAFRMAAYGLQHSHSYLGAFYRRVKSRLGAPKAITATAHKLARIVYAMLRNQTEYDNKGMEYYETHYRERVLANLKRNARRLGYQLIAVEPEVVASVPA
jgi:transposase